MRWNEVVTLLAPANKYQDAEGSWHEGEREERTVYCNEMTIGTMARAHLRSGDIRTENSTEKVDVGFHDERMLQVRKIDYMGEDRCRYHGTEYEVMYSSGAGETITLTVGVRVGNRVGE